MDRCSVESSVVLINTVLSLNNPFKPQFTSTTVAAPFKASVWFSFFVFTVDFQFIHV